MKKLSLLAFILALVLGASASTVNFAGLPAVNTPTLVPNGYGNLDWSNVYYVDPTWSGAGDGFRRGPSSFNVAYMGDGACEKEGASCSASISSNTLSLSPKQGFTAQNAIVAAGNHAESINVSAYNNGQFVGSQQYNLSTSLQEINFPVAWGTVTQLVIDANKGTVALYALKVNSASGSTSTKADQKAGEVSPPIEGAGPSALTLIKDPPPPHGASLDDGAVGPPVVSPNAHSSKGMSSDGLIVEPPVAAPNARSSKGLSSDGLIVEPPVAAPNARSSKGLSSDGLIVEPPVAAPNARGSKGLSLDDGIVGPPVLKSGPTAPKAGANAPKTGVTIAE
jgi:hypothetical protein